MTQRELEYLLSMGLVCYSTLLRRLGVKRATFYVIPAADLLRNDAR